MIKSLFRGKRRKALGPELTSVRRIEDPSPDRLNDKDRAKEEVVGVIDDRDWRKLRSLPCPSTLLYFSIFPSDKEQTDDKVSL